MTELLLLIAGAAVGLGVLYLVWRILRALPGHLIDDAMFDDDDDGEW